MLLQGIAAGIAALVLAAGAEPDAAELKISKVALFSSGVGYFETDATVQNHASAELKFRTDQINDILKSLVVQDFDKGTIGVVSYASRDPVDKALKSFGVNITGKPTLAGLLDQLRGEAVELAGPRALRGVIIGVEKQRITLDDKNTVEVDVLNLLTEAGLQQLRFSELGSIKLTNEKVNAELRKALETLAASHDADKKSVVLRFDGTGTRRVRASYLLETPIWKTSYRLVLNADKKPFLQGWATVENATEEDWKDVQLSLVSGRPISFTMDLYTPIYVPRPKEELELYASLRPPKLDAGMEVAKARAQPGRDAPKIDLQQQQGGTGGQGNQNIFSGGGGGGGDEDDRISASTSGFSPETAKMLRRRMDPAESGVASVANAAAAGELFEYAIKTPVSLHRQQSAMLPIVNEPIEGEKISIFNRTTHPKYPLNGLLLTNSTSLNLMQGPVTLFDGDAYAGDAKLPDLKPGEKRLIAYALDLAVEVTTEQRSQPDEVVSLRIAKGTLWHQHRLVGECTYDIRNKDGKDRSVLIEQPHSADWTLVEPKEPFERTPNLLRFKVPVPAGKTISQTIRMERLKEQSAELGELGPDGIRVYLTGRAITPRVKSALERVIALRAEVDDAVKQRTEMERQSAEAVQEQGRVRDNLKALEAKTDVHERQLMKFDELETQIEQLRPRTVEARKIEEQKRSALENYLLGLDVE